MAGTQLGHAVASLKAAFLPEDRAVFDADSPPRQQALSRCLDNAAHLEYFATLSHDDRATLLSEMLRGASAFLEAIPSKQDGLAWEPAEFVIELQQRLLLPVLSEENWCPLCDGVMDTKAHHARCCVAGGERTTRHHAVRNEGGQFAAAASLHPAVEKPGLLPPCPENQRREGAAQLISSSPPGSAASQQRWISR